MKFIKNSLIFLSFVLFVNYILFFSGIGFFNLKLGHIYFKIHLYLSIIFLMLFIYYLIKRYLKYNKFYYIVLSLITLFLLYLKLFLLFIESFLGGGFGGVDFLINENTVMLPGIVHRKNIYNGRKINGLKEIYIKNKEVYFILKGKDLEKVVFKRDLE